VAPRTGQGQEGHTLRGFDVLLHHPPPDPAAVELDPDLGAEADPAGQGGGNAVVEELVDGGEVGPDPHDAGARLGRH
jgi:hypothetical protein